ncbi:MAG: metallophosphoesterase [Gammaproteobacteria bacterium]|nr:metallophosphoesterase [Gammaproteobacteria bacterium]
MDDQPEPARVLHLTDPHLFADSEASLRGTVTRSSLQSVLNHFQQSAWPAQLVAVTGDIIQDDSREAYERFRAMLQPLGLPVYCVPGNHDVRSLMQEVLSEPPFYYCAALDVGNWLVAGIDSCVSSSAGGCIADAELTRLENLLGDTGAEHVMICLHHPPLPMGSRWLDSVGLDNAAEFLDLIAQFPTVRIAVFGHVHQNFDEMHGGIRIVGTPSTCRQFEPGSIEFAVDQKPPAYRRFSLHADGRIDDELVWLQDATPGA